MPPTTTSTIPHFLLPQRGSIWNFSQRNPQWIRSQTRNLSLKPKHGAKKSPPAKPKQIVLEKPARFNPPSHAAKRVKPAPSYPGPKLSEAEEEAMKNKKYPNMMPPDGSFMHWFLTKKSIHLYITLTTLFSMATYVWFTNFKRNSPFSDMLPSGSEFLFHPIAYTRTFMEVLKLTGDYNTAQTMERRRARVEDVAKRHEYRKAHGLDKDESFGGWTAKSDDELLGPGIRLGDGKREDGLIVDGGDGEQPVITERRPVKKWLGIW